MPVGLSEAVTHAFFPTFKASGSERRVQGVEFKFQGSGFEVYD